MERSIDREQSRTPDGVRRVGYEMRLRCCAYDLDTRWVVSRLKKKIENQKSKWWVYIFLGACLDDSKQKKKKRVERRERKTRKKRKRRDWGKVQ